MSIWMECMNMCARGDYPGISDEGYYQVILEKYNLDVNNGAISLPRDRDKVTEVMRKIKPDYDPDPAALEKRAALRDKARLALVKGRNLDIPQTLTRDLSQLSVTFTRQQQTFFALIKRGVTGNPQMAKDFEAAADQTNALRQLLDKIPDTDEKARADVQKRYDEKKKELLSLRSGIENSSIKFLLDNREKYEKMFERELTEEEIIERWPEISIVMAGYGEGEAFSSGSRPSDKHKSDLLTQNLVGHYGSLINRMNYIASDISSLVDVYQLMPLGQYKLVDGFIANGLSQEDDYVNELNIITGFMCNGVGPAYLADAYRQLGLNQKSDKPEEQIMILDTEGNVMDLHSHELFQRLFVEQEPVYAVPKSDPGVTPIVVQPINSMGYSVVGDKVLDAEISPVPDPPVPPAPPIYDEKIFTVPPVEAPKPNALVSALDSIFNAFSKIGGGDFHFESVRKYDEYLQKNADFQRTREERYADLLKNDGDYQKKLSEYKEKARDYDARVANRDKAAAKLEKAKERYGKLTSKEQLEKIHNKIVEYTKDTPETLKQKHELFSTRLARADKEYMIKEQAEKESNLIIKKSNPKKIMLPDNKQNTKEYNKFYKQLQAAIKNSPEDRTLLYKIAQQDNIGKLYKVYEAENAKGESSLADVLKEMKNLDGNQKQFTNAQPAPAQNEKGQDAPENAQPGLPV